MLPACMFSLGLVGLLKDFNVIRLLFPVFICSNAVVESSKNWDSSSHSVPEILTVLGSL